MIKTQVTRKRNKKVFDNLIKKVSEVNNQSVSIGYFKEQGIHKDAKMPYANLLYIHAFGLVHGAPVRDVMSHLKPMISGGNATSPQMLKLLRNYFKNKITVEQVFSDIGATYRDKGKAIFGNPSYLTATESNVTPLVDTGELQRNFAYKTSIKMEVVTR